MFLIYSLLYLIGAAVLLPFEYARRPARVRKRWLREKFGLIKPGPFSKDSPLIWVHAVSMGEVVSAVPFIREIRRRFPEVAILLSTITDTGQKVARERLSDEADIVYLPFDLVFILRRLLRRVRPSAFITVETELWPNIFRSFKRAGIPVLVMNGRISDTSFRGYRRVRFFMKEVVRCVDMFCMQDAVYAERIKALGADESKTAVTGNFKFDTRPPDRMPEWSGILKGPVILAGSTHEGEEEMILTVFERLKKDFPELTLVIAPRHPERFGDVEETLRARGLSYTKRSDISSAGCTGSSVLLLDTVGELASAYGACDIAVIGGSFLRAGGHNPLEPAFWGKPVVCGPHMENFPFVADFYSEGAAVAADKEGLCSVLEELLRSPERREAMGKRARELYCEAAGAVNMSIGILERYVELKLPLPEEKPLP